MGRFAARGLAKLWLCSGAAALVTKQDQVGAATNAKFSQQIRDVEFHGAFGNVQAVGDFFICEIFQQSSEHFLLAAAEFRRRITAQTAPLRGAKNRIHEAREDFAGNPEST